MSDNAAAIPAALRDPARLRGRIPKEYRYSAGKRSGFAVFQDRRGVILQYLDKDGLPRRVPKALREWFIADIVSDLSPRQIERMFGVTESLRQRMGLYAHLKPEKRAELDALTTDAQGSAPRRIAHESLDPERPLPADRSTLHELPTDRLPRRYTLVAMTPDPPRRFVYQTEFSLKIGQHTFRPDEVVLSYQMTQAEIDLVKNGVAFDDIKRTHPHALDGVKDFDLHVWDNNADLTGQRAADHVKKAARYLSAALQHTLEDLGLRPQGMGRVRFTDIFQDPAHYVIGERSVETARSSGHHRAPDAATGTLRKVQALLGIDFGDGRKPWSVAHIETEAFGHARALLKGPVAQHLRTLVPAIERTLHAFSRRR